MREFDTIDEEIEVLEQKIADLDSEMMISATNSVKLGELMVKKDETEKASGREDGPMGLPE